MATNSETAPKDVLPVPEECSMLGGNWFESQDYTTGGECLKPTGGSFSFDCRELNTSVQPKDGLPPMLDAGSPMIGDPIKAEAPPPNAVPEVFASNGKSCGAYGVPSDDNRVRLYTQDECNILGGNWSMSTDYTTGGDCYIPEGGSYGYDCRALNGGVQSFTNISRSKKSRRTESFYGGDDLKCKARY
jgi:hypothetical protein